jgi:hypothetical protein
MQLLLASQTCSPDGQLHAPPGIEHVSPVTLQLELSQHVPVVMHWELAPMVHPVLPAGHEQVPPGAEHSEPGIDEQSSFEQQLAVAMHVMFTAHAFWPLGHAHAPPGAGQLSPVTVQSLLVQHDPVGMQTSPLGQYCVPVAHASVHIPPLQMCPGAQR